MNEQENSVPTEQKIPLTIQVINPQGERVSVEMTMNQKGFVRLKDEQKGRRKKWKISHDSSLENLIKLKRYISSELKLDIKRMTVQSICEIATIYLALPVSKKVSNKTGRTTTYYSHRAYNLAYALFHLYA